MTRVTFFLRWISSDLSYLEGLANVLNLYHLFKVQYMLSLSHLHPDYLTQDPFHMSSIQDTHIFLDSQMIIVVSIRELRWWYFGGTLVLCPREFCVVLLTVSVSVMMFVYRTGII